MPSLVGRARAAVVHPRRHSSRSALALAAVVAIGASGCATNPVTGKSMFSLVSESQEIEIGKEQHGAIIGQFGVYEDTYWSTKVDSIGQAMARLSHRPHLAWSFTVLDDPTVNAFALPGGYIYITRGILAHLNSEAQLAGVLGHEIGHVTARHGVDQVSKAQLAQLGLGVAGAMSQTFQQFGGLAQQSLQLLFLKHGRDDESQSDGLGIEYSIAAGYDPRDIPATYEMLGRISEQASSRLPEFLSTHPDPGNRAIRTRELSDAAAAGRTGLKVNADGYKKSLDGMVYGDNPRHGYFEESAFYHPDLRFALDFPSGWKTMNTRQAVLAQSPEQTAQMQMTLAEAGDASPERYVAQLAQKGVITDYKGAAERIGGNPAWVGRVAVAGEGGQSVALPAAFVSYSGNLYQFIAQVAEAGGGDERAFFASARSFRALTDSARLNPQPMRVRVAATAKSGSLATVLPSLGPQGAPAEAVAVMNNADLGDNVGKGQLVKFVAPAKLR